MPYEVKRSGSCPPSRPFGVFKSGESKSLGCHPTAEAAQKQLRALYAQEAVLVGKDTVGEGTYKGRDIFSAAEAVFTEEADGPIRADVVIVRPGESQNRRFYSQEAIDRAIESGFWENSPMYIDHPDDIRVPTKRKLQSLVAGLSNVRRGPSGEAVGTATFFNREFGKFAMEAKDHVGVSGVHYFKGQRYKGTDKHYHERVDDFLANVSVDFVAFPAAGGQIMQFLPAMESEDGVEIEWTDITREQLEQNRPDLVEALKGTVAAESQGNPTGVPGGGNPPNPVPPEPKPEPKPDEGVTLSREDIIKVVGEALDQRDKAVTDREAVAAKAKEILGKSGLPEPVRVRIQNDLAARATAENIESLATESIESAKAEGKAWAPPRVSGMGASVPTPAAAGETKPIPLAVAAEQSTAIGAFFGPMISGTTPSDNSGQPQN